MMITHLFKVFFWVRRLSQHHGRKKTSRDCFLFYDFCSMTGPRTELWLLEIWCCCCCFCCSLSAELERLAALEIWLLGAAEAEPVAEGGRPGVGGPPKDF